jgi:protein-tyrosine phosphatase
MFEKLGEIFRKREKLVDPVDFSRLKVDVHSHFIPGIDDGSDSIETSLELIQGMIDFGYKKVITTPHVMSDYYRNTPEIIQSGCDRLREALEEREMEIEIECAAEYYLDADLKRLVKSKQLLTFGSDYVLFELPFMNEPLMLAELIFEMQLAGYKPVLAHPERYTFWHMNFEKYQEMLDKGVLLQLNINSLTGHYSPQVKKIAIKLIQNGMIQLVGSDCHHLGHIQLMKQASQVEEFHQLIESGLLLNSTL